jgi:aminopeptidase N
VNKISIDKVCPLSYDIFIDVTSLSEDDNDLITGYVIYEFSVIQPTNLLKLNLDGILITQLVLLDSIRNLPTPKQELTKDLLQIRFLNPLEVSSSNKIQLNFTTKFSSPSLGHFVHSYKDVSGKKKRMCITKFEHCGARLAFPVVDQPNAKAIFSLRLLHPSGTRALSNMPIFSSNTYNQPFQHDSILTVFEPSLIMSSYLLVWAVGLFSCVYLFICSFFFVVCFFR